MREARNRIPIERRSMKKNDETARMLVAALLFVSCATTGCSTPLMRPNDSVCVPAAIPRELQKVTLPDYIIEPPDVVSINAVNVLIPKPPYKLRPLDSILINVRGTPDDLPVDGVALIEADGTVLLGYDYGAVMVAGKTTDEAKEAIREHMQKFLKEEPEVFVTISQTAAAEQIAGSHLVQLDGKVNLGTHGHVRLVGMTIEQAREAIEQHLAQNFVEPEISVDMVSFNSKSYYVVTQGAGLGDSISSFPIQGNETVLDAVAQVGGLSSLSSYHMWVARPGGNSSGGDQLLPVNLPAIMQRADSSTNYQLFPGDRLYIAEDFLVAIDNQIGKVVAPVERAVGFGLLFRTFQNQNQQGRRN